MKNLLIFFAIILFIGIALTSFWNIPVPERSEHATNNIDENDSLQVEIESVVLDSDAIKTIFTSNLQPTVRITNKQIVSMSIDGSADVLFDDFYGHIQYDGTYLVFKPNYNLNPGIHRLKIETDSNSFEYSFKIAYLDSFQEIQEARWQYPENSSRDWFESDGDNLVVRPETEISHSSIFFTRPVGQSFIVNFSLKPHGNVLALVPYVIDGVGYEFALDTNGVGRNSLFGPQDNSIRGEEYDFRADAWYQIRLVKEKEQITLYVAEISSDKSDPSLANDSFHKIFSTISSQSNEPYTFGISLWQQSDGATIGDIYIETI